MTTPNFGLEQPAYLSDGAAAVSAVNSNFAKIDVLLTYIVCYEGNPVTYKNELVTSV